MISLDMLISSIELAPLIRRGPQPRRFGCPRRRTTWSVGGLAPSDPRVPGPAGLDVSLLAAVFEPVRHDETPQVLHALVAHLPLHAQAHRRAVREREIAPVHAVGQDGLRVEG